jgi:hypothetical protein
MLIFDTETKSIFLNDKAIIDCTFDRKWGTVEVLTPTHKLNYANIVNVAYIPEGSKEVQEREVAPNP